LKLPVPACSLLLAAAILLAAPFAAQETGGLHLGGTAEGMGSQPGDAPGQADNTTATVGLDGQASDAVIVREPARRPEDGNTTDSGQSPRQDEPGEDRIVIAKTADKPWRAQPETIRDSGPGSRADEERAPHPDAPVESRNAPRARTTPEATGGAEPGGRMQSQKAPIRLFNTVAFRGNFNALPKWKRVLSKAGAQVRTLNTCAPGQKGCPPGAASWQRILKQARDLPVFEKLKTVNAFFNKWPYRLDQDAYGTSDWWATPQEFLKLSGDCEDFAITKYYALRELGFSADDMRIVVLQDRIRGIAHAILAVFVDTDAYVLDNVSSVVFSHSKYRHYVPYYSLNEKYRWSHIPLDKKP
jgi:predicted transglutaminase-like cysteine proteinase